MRAPGLARCRRPEVPLDMMRGDRVLILLAVELGEGRDVSRSVADTLFGQVAGCDLQAVSDGLQSLRGSAASLRSSGRSEMA